MAENKMCRYMDFITGLGVYWCWLKDENGRQKHPKCECENCPDKQEMLYVTDTSDSLTIDQLI